MGSTRMAYRSMDEDDGTPRESDEDSDADDATSLDSEHRLEKEDEVRTKACILLTELLFYHKLAFEAESEDAAQVPLAELHKKFQEYQSDEEFKIFRIGTVGKRLSQLMEHELNKKFSAFKPKTGVGVWRDPSGHFYSGYPVDIYEDRWEPRMPKDSENISFSIEGACLVHKRSTGHLRHEFFPGIDDELKLTVVTGGHKKVLQAHYDWDRWEHFDMLNGVWKTLEIGDIGTIMVECGPYVNKFVHSLAVKIPSDLAGSFSLRQLEDDEEVQVHPGKLERCTDAGDFKRICKLPSSWSSNKRKIHGPCSHSFLPRMVLNQLLATYPKKTRVDLYYTSCTNILDLARHDSHDGIKFLLFLETPPNELMVFTTPVGLGTTAIAWDLGRPMFCWMRFTDIVFIVAICVILAPVTRTITAETRADPSAAYFILAGLLMMRNAVIFLVFQVGFFLKMWVKDIRAGTVSPIPLNMQIFVQLCVEMYTIVWAIRLFRDFRSHFLTQMHIPFIAGSKLENDTYHLEDTFLARNPMGVTVLIFVKCIQWMTLILNFRVLRGSVLPVWFTIISQESVYFIVYMLLLTLGCSLAYMALPFDSNPTPGLWNNGDPVRIVWEYFRPFFRMFRLNIMGDFDVSELMGDETIYNFSSPDCTFEHWDPKKCYLKQDSKQFNTDGHLMSNVKAWIMLLALMFPVIFLNVYVGMVGEVYTNVKSNLVQTSRSFTAATLHRELSFRDFWIHFCCGIFSFDRCSRRPKRMFTNGAFIRVPTALVGEPKDVGISSGAS